MPDPKPAPNTTRRFLWFLLGAFLLVLILLGIAWWWDKRAPAPESKPVQPQPSQTSHPQTPPPPPESSSPDRYGGKYFYAGIPKSSQPLTVLTNLGYVVGYSESRKDPVWVCYRLFSVNSLQAPPRPPSFSVDTRTRARVHSSDYTGCGYQRGHQAPNYAIAVCYGSQAQLQTFLMSNILPQRPHLNQEVWENLERLEIRDYAQRFKEIWVVTGPIFKGSNHKLRNGTEIPAACYKIIIDEVDGKPRMLAFQMGQDVIGNEPLIGFLTRVDEIEKESGLDFFSDLEDGMENRLEGERAKGMW